MNNPTPRSTPYTTICLSGGFDPIHVGHLRMLKEATKYGQVTVIVNSDEWLQRKKGFIFMPFEERCEILEGLECVTRTVLADDDDNTVCKTLKRLKPDYFGNGGDRKTENTPEIDLCAKEGIQLVWALGGGKIQSSSDLVKDSGLYKDMDSDPKPSKTFILSAGLD